jgi:hypothetical protein
MAGLFTLFTPQNFHRHSHCQSGAQRSRLLSTLFKDERSPELPVFNLLEKVGWLIVVQFVS